MSCRRALPSAAQSSGILSSSLLFTHIFAAGCRTARMPWHQQKRATRLSLTLSPATRRETFTGRPCGSDGFIRRLEALTDRFLHPLKPGPKPPRQPQDRRCSLYEGIPNNCGSVPEIPEIPVPEIQMSAAEVCRQRRFTGNNEKRRLHREGIPRPGRTMPALRAGKSCAAVPGTNGPSTCRHLRLWIIVAASFLAGTLSPAGTAA